MKRCFVVCAGFVTMIAIGIGAAMPAGGPIPVTWDGSADGDGDNVNYSDPENWDLEIVPCNVARVEFSAIIGDKGVATVTFDGGDGGVLICDVTELFLADDSTLIINPATSYTAVDMFLGDDSTLNIGGEASCTAFDIAEIFGIIDSDGGDFTATGPGAAFPGNRARLRANAGGVLTIAAPTYSSIGLHTTDNDCCFDEYIWPLMTAADAGTFVDLSALQLIDAGFDDLTNTDRNIHQITATLGAVVDLSGVDTIIAPVRGPTTLFAQDWLEIVIQDGSTIDLSSLETLTTASTGRTQFEVDASELFLPSLVSMERVVYFVDDGALVTVGDSVTSVIDSQWILTGGSQFLGGNGAASFTSTGLTRTDNDCCFDEYGWSLFTATDESTLLDLSFIESIDDGFDDLTNTDRNIHRITASLGSQIDLSGTQWLRAPVRSDDWIEITVSDGSLIDLSSLDSLESASAGTVQVKLSSGGELRVGDLEISANTTITLDDPGTTLRAIGGLTAAEGLSVAIVINDADGALDIDGSLVLGSEITITAPNGARVNIGGQFSHSHIEEDQADLSKAIVHFDGSGTQRLEVGGVDLPLDFCDAVNENFGFGQLIVGQDGQETELLLRDDIDNDNGDTEALYLFGAGNGEDSLRILGGSTLVLNGLNVYLCPEGLHLNDLFIGNPNRIEYDEGYIKLFSLGGGIGYAPPNEVAAAGEPNREATGDLLGKGRDDVMVTIPDLDPRNVGQVQLFRNLGNDDETDLWIGLEADDPIDVGREPTGIALGLINGDQQLDAVVSNAGDNTLSILTNQGDGEFSETTIDVGNAPSDVLAADLSMDGIVDLVVSNQADDTIWIFFNDGNGNFGKAVAMEATEGLGLLGIEPEDLDNDKCVDIVGINQFAARGEPAGSVFVILNDGKGNFAPAVTYEVGVNPQDLSVGDIDLDGFADIVVANADDATISVLLNLGDGTFAPRIDIPVGADPRSVEAADLDGDGDPDLAVVANDAVIGPAVQVLRNISIDAGEAVFDAPVAFGVDAQPNFVVSADFNTDQLTDLVTVNADEGATGGSVTVLIHVQPETVACVWDLNGSGIVGPEDLIILLGSWGDPYGAEDLIDLLGAWGPCE